MTAVDLLQGQVTQEEALAALKGFVLSAPNPPEEATLDAPGTPENAFLWALSLAEEARSGDRANYALAAFRSTAPIEWLRLHALEMGLVVQFAGYATTSVNATNTSGNAYPSAGVYEPGELRVVVDATKAIFENTQQVAIAPAQLLPFVPSTVSFGVRAIESGTASNAGIGEIDRLETALEGVTVTNPSAAITVDDETKESINQRIDALYGIAGVAGANDLSTGGPEKAIEAIALNGRDKGGGCLRADGTRVRVADTKVVRDDSTGTSTLYVRDDDGPLEPADVTVVRDEVTWYASRICSTVTTTNVSNTTITVNASMTVRKTSLTDSEIETAIDVAFPLAAQDVPIGGFDLSPDDGVPIEYTEGAIRGAAAGKWQIVTIAVTLPASLVVLAAGEVPEFVRGTIAITRIS
jgi:hypothetical protein